MAMTPTPPYIVVLMCLKSVYGLVKQLLPFGRRELAGGLWARARQAGADTAIQRRNFGIADDIYAAGLLLAYMAFMPFCQPGSMDGPSLQRWAPLSTPASNHSGRLCMDSHTVLLMTCICRSTCICLSKMTASTGRTSICLSKMTAACLHGLHAYSALFVPCCHVYLALPTPCLEPPDNACYVALVQG